jgi:hypothetical protein
VSRTCYTAANQNLHYKEIAFFSPQLILQFCFFTILLNYQMPRSPPSTLISDLMLPELERQLSEDDTLWPNVKGLFIITVTKRRKPAATWYNIYHV